MTIDTGVLLGAYAMSPADTADEERFYAGVADLGVGGLELPLFPQGAPSLEPAWIARNVSPAWDLLITCIPTVMGRLSTAPGYGLASADEAGRRQALDDVARAQALALRLADQHGRRRVVAIQVHSAPGPAGGSGDALARSLAQILAWDLAGARVLVEHCDTVVPGQAAAKGFLSIHDEIAAIVAAGAGPGTSTPGLSVNWGRSAIEGRSTQTPVGHVRAAVSAGVLGAVVFSGAADSPTSWGPPWSDAHIPPRGQAPGLDAASGSLLSGREITATLRAAGDLPLIAVKVSVRPDDADVPTRLAVARAALDLVNLSRSPSGREQ